METECIKPLPSCPCCKEKFLIDRNSSLEGIVFFENHYYHKECFLNKNKNFKIKKSCGTCGVTINICDGNLGEVAYYKDKFHHVKCLEEWCNSKNKTKAKTNVKNNFELYKNYSIEKYYELKGEDVISDSSLKKLHNDALIKRDEWFNGKELLDFLQDQFGIKNRSVIWSDTIMPIVNGTHKKYTTPIPIEDLLYMFKRRINKLKKANGILQSRNDNQIDPISFIKYDIAILEREYDSYLAWKERNKRLESEETNIPIEKVTKLINTSKISTKEKDISDITDDIFG